MKKLNALLEEVRLTKSNLQLLTQAKKDCECDGRKLHYHLLINYDAESGDIYEETSDARHARFIAKLRRRLHQVEKIK